MYAKRKQRDTLCKTIPCTIYSDRVLVEFIHKDNQINSVENFIRFLDRFEGKFLRAEKLDEKIREYFSDQRYRRFIMKTIKRFYNLKKPSPSNFGKINDTKSYTFEAIREEFYQWLNKNYNGFMPRNLRGKLLREFVNTRNLSLDILNKALSYIDTRGFIVHKVKEFALEDFVGLLNYHLITAIISKCNKLRILLEGMLGRIVKKFVYQAKKLHVLDFASITKENNKIKIEFDLPVYEYAGARISPKSSKLAYLIATLFDEKETNWVFNCYIQHGKSIVFRMRKSSPWLPIIKTPKDIQGWSNVLFDSALEENLFGELKKILDMYVVEREAEIIFLENKGLIVPDFTIRCGKKKIFVELIGYWRKTYLEKKKEKLGRVPKDIKLILFLTERNWFLLQTDFPKIKITNRGKIREKWAKTLKRMVDSICS